MGSRQDVAHHLGGPAGIDQVIHDEHTLAAPPADADHACRYVLEHLELALRDMIVARHANRLDQADTELARDNPGWNETPAGDADDCEEWAGTRQPPREGARVPVEFVPRNRERLVRLLRLRGGLSLLRHGHALLVCAPLTRASIPSTAALARVSFSASRARSTTLVLGPCCGPKNG